MSATDYKQGIKSSYYKAWLFGQVQILAKPFKKTRLACAYDLLSYFGLLQKNKAHYDYFFFIIILSLIRSFHTCPFVLFRFFTVIKKSLFFSPLFAASQLLLNSLFHYSYALLADVAYLLLDT